MIKTFHNYILGNILMAAHGKVLTFFNDILICKKKLKYFSSLL